ncbi:MAG TPA: hypothetical protein VFD92_21125 [Candidatus Binatia bacterium]|nr:hypothetical protein [Candidatus Binatia bacterium]
MAEDIFEDRRRALEEAFFRKYNGQLLDRLKAEDRRRDAKESLRQATGIRDDAVLDRLVNLGFDASTLLAFGLVPAIEVAWADGAVDPEERTAILEELSPHRIPKGSPAYEMIASWLARRPPPEVFDTWVAYTRALLPTLEPRDREWLASTILQRAEHTADASGGVLGLALRTSRSEAEVIRRIEQALAGV